MCASARAISRSRKRPSRSTGTGTAASPADSAGIQCPCPTACRFHSMPPTDGPDRRKPGRDRLRSAMYRLRLPPQTTALPQTCACGCHSRCSRKSPTRRTRHPSSRRLSLGANRRTGRVRRGAQTPIRCRSSAWHRCRRVRSCSSARPPIPLRENPSPARGGYRAHQLVSISRSRTRTCRRIGASIDRSWCPCGPTTQQEPLLGRPRPTARSRRLTDRG